MRSECTAVGSQAIARAVALLEFDCTLDLDLLLYGDRVDEAERLPRREILEYAFVLKPLADIAGGERHPLTGRTYAEHWSGFQGEGEASQTLDLTGL